VDFDYTILASVNASLNAVSAVLLVCGFLAIKNRKIDLHRKFMVSAFAVSVVFLASYLVYHYHVGSVKFTGTGVVRTFYFVVLISHIILAAATPFLAIITLWRALSERFDKHRRIARWTLPIWLYVSVTGVIVYWMLYRMSW